jgi:hypothetical protein
MLSIHRSLHGVCKGKLHFSGVTNPNYPNAALYGGQNTGVMNSYPPPSYGTMGNPPPYTGSTTSYPSSGQNNAYPSEEK